MLGQKRSATKSSPRRPDFQKLRPFFEARRQDV